MDKLFLMFTNGKPAQETSLQITENRAIKVQGRGKVLRLDFRTIFKGSYGASDFIAMCAKYEVVLAVKVDYLPGERREDQSERYKHVQTLYIIRSPPFIIDRRGLQSQSEVIHISRGQCREYFRNEWIRIIRRNVHDS